MEQINYQFLEELKSLFRLHIVTKEFKHIIEYEPGSWKMFEPTKFVYSYFAFNTFYNYDWVESFKNQTLTLFKEIEDKALTETQKFKSMIDFIFDNTSPEERNTLVKFILRPNNRENPIQKAKLVNYINGITTDNKITESERESFKREFNNLIESEELKIGKLKKDILRFIYLVRNNIFHGTKTTIEMSDINQRKRLDIYSNILIGVNELLFKSFENKTNQSFDRNYKLNLDGRNQQTS